MQFVLLNLLVNLVYREQLPRTIGSPGGPKIKHQGLALILSEAHLSALKVLEGKLWRFVWRGENEQFKLL